MRVPYEPTPLRADRPAATVRTRSPAVRPDGLGARWRRAGPKTAQNLMPPIMLATFVVSDLTVGAMDELAR